MGARLFLVALLVSAPTAEGTQRLHTSASLTINPIRKVVTLLQAMQSKVEEEGKKETDLYNKFMCYCQSSGDTLKESMAAAEAKISALTSQLEAKEEAVASMKQALKQAQVDRSAAKAALQDGAAVREKEAGEFAALKGDSDANIIALNKAIAAIEKGVAGFFQTSAASSLKALLRKTIPGLYDMDRQVLTAFLDGSQQSGYAPASGEIVGILKQLAGTMGADLREADATEKAAIETYSAMVSAKQKEIDALTAFIEAKMAAVGEASVVAVQMKNDLAATKESLTADLGFSADLAKGCESKKAEWQNIVQTRSEELAALAETINILSDDDALELFKKTLPGASAFMQVDATAATFGERALAFVQLAKEGNNRRHHVGLDMISLALHGRKISFARVLKMIDAMVKTLEQEQLDDDHKLEYCNKQFEFADNKMKELSRTLSNEEAASASATDAISKLTEELAALETGLKKLDESVADSTAQRKAEHAEFQELLSSDASAKALLEFAKNRLNKFYSPRLYKPTAKTELSAEDRIFVSQGGTPQPAAPAGGIAGTGISAFVQVSLHSQDVAAPPPPPETFGAYSKKSGEHGGVIAMMDLLIKDLEKEMQEASVEEKQSQADYEAMMRDAAEQRVVDSKAITTKASAKAELEDDLQSHNEAGANAKAELLATSQFAADLHAECDWLLKYAAARKGARDNEISNLGNAKAVLSGADYSL